MIADRMPSAAANAPAIAGRHYCPAGAADDVAVLTLDDRGRVCDCNGAGEALFKYSRAELFWQHVSLLLPQLADLELIQDGEPNPHLRFLCRIGLQFQAVAQDGERFASELFLNLLDSAGHGRLSLIVRPAGGVAGRLAVEH